MSSFNRLSAAAIFAFYVSPIASAAVVTATFTPSVVRTQTQGAGTYDVMDFFWTSASGAEFMNYTFEAIATSGFLQDPARLQDDRQTANDPGTQNGNTRGAVDTWMNTVMSAAAKEDAGYFATIVANPAYYAPSGTGAAPPFTHLKWDVFDMEAGDDNNLNDHPDGSFNATAPYHIARLVTTPGTTGSVSISAYDTSQPNVPFVFNFPGEGILTHVVDAEIFVPNRNDPGFVEHTFGYTGQPPVAWDNFEFLSYAPNYGAPSAAPGAAAAANATFNPDTAEFHWTTTGAPRGDYVWQVRVHDFFGPADNGTLTVRVVVPEPSAAALCGAFLLAASGIARRRSSAPATGRSFDVS
jgi:hypothetical protein